MGKATVINSLTNKPTNKIADLFKGYFFHSDEKLKAWLLLIGIALCVIGVVAAMTAFSWWFSSFSAILMAKSYAPFLACMGQFAFILTAFVAVSSLKTYLSGKLSISWRNWLTKKTISELFDSENNYLELKRFSPFIDNIAQRVQEDIQRFVDITINLGAEFFRAALSLAAFTTTLWVIGGALVIGSIVIPGYLVWAALIAATLATVITRAIGKSLPNASQEAEHAEADLRQNLVQLNNEAENIAEEHAEKYYQATTEKNTQRVKEASEKKLNIQTNINGFQYFYFMSMQILPTLLTVPLYFSGLIEYSQLIQVGFSFGEVNSALSTFADCYTSIAECKANIARIAALKEAFEKNGLPAANDKSIVRKVRDKETIKIKNLDIMQPKSSNANYILRGLNVKLEPNEDVLIKGPSGIGKSTVLKVISGTWKYGHGKVSVPSKKCLYFLPQTPVLPNDTLKAVLAFPDPVSTYTTEVYVSVLKSVRMDRLILALDQTRDWSRELSGGEKQRISVARALLKKPDWLILDEATASLDEEGEDDLYRTMKRELKKTTIVSIGHRSTIEKHHAKILFFRAKENNEVEVEIKSVARNQDACFIASGGGLAILPGRTESVRPGYEPTR